MMNKFYKLTKVASFVAIIAITGCAGMGNGGGLYGNSGAYGLGSSSNNSVGGINSNVLSAIIQGMAGSVLNGQIGSQLAPTDQNYRLQQLGSLVQSGGINQAQQWTIPQSGNTIAISPVGQQVFSQQLQRPCRNLEEVLILQNGNRIRENRRACLDPRTKKWNLVQ